MQEVNILNLIKNSSAEIVVATTITSIIMLATSTSHKFSSKTFFIISFSIGTAVCFLLSLFLCNFSVSYESLKNSVSAGTLSVTVTAFIKRFTVFDGDDVKADLQKLLSSIILSDKLDEVVDEIISNLTENKPNLTEDSLKSIIRENTDVCDEKKLSEVCRIIMEALEEHKKI